MKNHKKAFTLVEVLVSILISAIIIITWFQAYTMVLAWKVRLIERTKLQKEAQFFTERLFQLIKEWGTLDYEEYFNRKVVWIAMKYGHYEKDTGFGNFWDWWIVWSIDYWTWFYYCRSWNGISQKMTFNWCYNDASLNNFSKEEILEPQRYGQYSFQFIDYNIDNNWDYWNPDWTWSIIWDDDDEDLWNWPEVFISWVNIKELYLISWDKKHRTFFRYRVESDPDAPTTETCDFDMWTWTWCLGTIEFLKLDWEDYWMDHNSWFKDNFQNDWVIDTWFINKNFSNWAEVVAWSDSNNYWKSVFPKSINVSKFKVFAYPNKDQDRAWRENEKISPYVILNIEIQPSWKIRKKIKWNINPMNFNTTINLTEIFSK